MPREILLEDLKHPIVQAYLTFTKEVAVFFGADENRADKEMLEAVKFEIAMAKLMLPKYV